MAKAKKTSKKKAGTGKKVTKRSSVGGEYIPPLHNLNALPPYMFEKLTTLSFLLKSDNDKQRELTDRYLNKPLNGAASFTPTGTGITMLVVSHFPVCFGQQNVGLIDYKEVALMFPVIRKRTSEVSLFSPLLILDGARQSDDWQAAMPVALGREFYGLPKIRGEISFNSRHNLPEEDVGIYSASVKAPSVVNAKVPIPLQTFVDVEPEKAPSLSHEIELGDRQIASHISKVFGISKPKPRDGIRLDSPLIGLNQMAHPGKIGKTIAQAVIRSPLKMKAQPRMAASDVTITFNTRDHGKLIDALGLKEQYKVPRRQGWVWRDAEAEFGEPSGTTVWVPS